jgi:Domain of unknown function (DUF5753)
LHTARRTGTPHIDSRDELGISVTPRPIGSEVPQSSARWATSPRLRHQADLDVVHIESLTSALYVEDREQVEAYRGAFERLRAVALPVEASADQIREIRKAHT